MSTITTERTSKRIVAMRPGTEPATKTSLAWKGSWSVPVVYTLDDGTEQLATQGPFSRKMDATAAAQERSVGNMTANYEDGRFIGTTTTYGLGRTG